MKSSLGNISVFFVTKKCLYDDKIRIFGANNVFWFKIANFQQEKCNFYPKLIKFVQQCHNCTFVLLLNAKMVTFGKNRIFCSKIGVFGGKLPKNMLFQDPKSDSNVGLLKNSDFRPKMTSFSKTLSFNENNVFWFEIPNFWPQKCLFLNSKWPILINHALETS